MPPLGSSQQSQSGSWSVSRREPQHSTKNTLAQSQAGQTLGYSSSLWACAGWCIWVFVLVSGVLLAVVNTKLVWIARYVTRGGHVHQLRPGIFWLNRPWMLLPVIKFLLFFVSYCYSNAIFFATQFGSSSCFFSSAGFQGQPVPWWVSCRWSKISARLV